MKAITPDNLQDILDSDLVWRRREISSLITLARRSSISDRVTIVRAAIPLLYAHWEGFGRSCFVRYLEHVSYRALKFRELRPSFLYMASIGSLSQLGKSPTQHEIDLLQSILDRNNLVNKDDFRKRVSTRSNLRGSVLRELLSACGLDWAGYETDESFLDSEICDARNEIAHGAGGAPSLDTFVTRRDRLFSLMTQLQAQVVNAAVQAEYRVQQAR